MAALLDIAPLVVALFTMFVSVSPAAQLFFYRSYRWLMCIVQPSHGSCLRMLWSDIPDGLLHQCDPHYCQHEDTRQLRPHGSMGCCWDDTIGQVFNRMWYLINSNPKIMRSKKPSELNLREDYVQTDVHTLKAYLMLSSEICHKCETPDLVTLLEVQNLDGISTVHLKATVPVPINPKVTKFEIDRFIEGYPPFYRSTLETTGGITLNHPIDGTDDLGKGAWVLAVGMTTKNGPICAVYNMQRVPQEEKSETYWRGTLVMTAFKMIKHTLFLLKTYEEQQGQHPRPNPSKISRCANAINCYDKIIDPEYSAQPQALKFQQIEESALFKDVIGECPCKYKCLGKEAHAATCRRGQKYRKDPARDLTKEQCSAAFEIFSHFQHSIENLEIIWPVLPEVLQSLILGMAEVEHYFSHTGQKLDLPRALTGKRHIYLRKCPSDID